MQFEHLKCANDDDDDDAANNSSNTCKLLSLSTLITRRIEHEQTLPCHRCRCNK